MSVFEFIKSASDKMAEGLEKATEAVREAEEKKALELVQARIKDSKIGAKDLALKFTEPGSLKIYAVVESADDKEDLILLAGNSAGVHKVEDAIKVRPPGATADVTPPAPRFYTVKSGDTLGAIAKSQLGSKTRYMEIFNANKHILKDPDQIDVGQTLRLPK